MELYIKNSQVYCMLIFKINYTFLEEYSVIKMHFGLLTMYQIMHQKIDFNLKSGTSRNIHDSKNPSELFSIVSIRIWKLVTIFWKFWGGTRMDQTRSRNHYLKLHFFAALYFHYIHDYTQYVGWVTWKHLVTFWYFDWTA